jgi:hypothetical protein
MKRHSGGLGVSLYEHPSGGKRPGNGHNRRRDHRSRGVEHGPAERRGCPVIKTGPRRRFKAGPRTSARLPPDYVSNDWIGAPQPARLRAPAAGSRSGRTNITWLRCGRFLRSSTKVIKACFSPVDGAKLTAPSPSTPAPRSIGASGAALGQDGRRPPQPGEHQGDVRSPLTSVHVELQRASQ